MKFLLLLLFIFSPLMYCQVEVILTEKDENPNTVNITKEQVTSPTPADLSTSSSTFERRGAIPLSFQINISETALKSFIPAEFDGRFLIKVSFEIETNEQDKFESFDVSFGGLPSFTITTNHNGRVILRNGPHMFLELPYEFELDENSDTTFVNSQINLGFINYKVSSSFMSQLESATDEIVVAITAKPTITIVLRTDEGDTELNTFTLDEGIINRIKNEQPDSKLADYEYQVDFYPPAKVEVFQNGTPWLGTITSDSFEIPFTYTTNAGNISLSGDGVETKNFVLGNIHDIRTFNQSDVVKIPHLGWNDFQVFADHMAGQIFTTSGLGFRTFANRGFDRNRSGFGEGVTSAVYNRKNLSGDWKVRFFFNEDGGFRNKSCTEKFTVSDETPSNLDFEDSKFDDYIVFGGGTETSLFGFTTLGLTPDDGNPIPTESHPLRFVGSFDNPIWGFATFGDDLDITFFVEQGKIIVRGELFGFSPIAPVYFEAEVQIQGGSDNTLEENDCSLVTREVAHNFLSISANKIQNLLAKTAGSPANTPCDSGCANSPGISQCPSPAGSQLGDPVALNNLEMICSNIDMEIAGRGISYRFERYYKSRVNFNGPIGQGWDHSYNMRLVQNPGVDTEVILYHRMRGDAYQVLSDGSILSPQTHFNKIVKDDAGFFFLREANGTIYKFFPFDDPERRAGKLASITTRCGNALTMTYNDKGLLDTVFDSLSRPIKHEYDDNNRIVKITDFVSREVVYTYNDLGQLVSVRSPVVENTPNGNDFPDGKLQKYVYSSGFDNENLNNNLLQIIQPNESATSNAASVTNFYDADDRLFKQEWSGTNASGVDAGGTIFYAREVINENVDLENLELPREVVTVTDRRGNIVVLSYNINKNLIKKEVKTRGLRENDPESFITIMKYNDAGLQTEVISPLQNRVVTEYDENNNNVFQRGNPIRITVFPDAVRGADQDFLKVEMEYEPVFNQMIRYTEQRELADNFQPQNGGSVTPGRYTSEYVPDYFEGNLDTAGCSCGFTLRELIEKYNIDITSVQNKLEQGDLNEDSTFSICGNIVLFKSPQVNLRSNSLQAASEGGTVQTIATRVSYSRYGQILKTETAEGEVNEYFYYPENDPDGDGADVLSGKNHLGEDFDPQGGYLKQVIVDSIHTARYRGSIAPTNLTSTFGYDRVGNVVFVVNPRGIRSEFIFNELNQIVEARSATDVSQATEDNLTAFAYKTRIFYDANNNVVKTQQEYRDGNNANLPNFIEATVKYDILDNPIETTQTVDNDKILTTQMRYDENENLVEVRSPLAVSGVDPNNIVKTTYDERDLVISVTSAPGTVLESKSNTVVDANGNVIETIDAEDSDGDGQREKTLIKYDGYDRVIETTTATGEVVQQKYDPASNVIETSIFGTIGGISRTNNSTAGNTLLSRTHMFYDELSRVFRQDAELFVATGVTTVRPVTLNDDDLTPGDGRVTSFIEYDRNSRVTFTVSASPNGQEVSSVEYDGASRVVRAVDAENNEVSTVYDNNSNAIAVTTTERNSAGRIADETFTTTTVFDSLDRPVSVTDNIGQTSFVFYDSRNLAIKTADAQGPQNGDTNDLGNVNEVIHDGLGRVIQTTQELTVDGQGGSPLDLSNPANADGKITESNVWDDNSRLVSVQDDNGNTTTYEYDSLNRLTKTIFADGKFTESVYTKDHNVLQYTDNNGSVCAYTYDGSNRLLQKNITRSTTNNIVGTTQQTFEYDGLSRLTKATDNNNPNDTTDDSVVERNYDSLSRLVEEKQNGHVVSMNWREEGDLAECIYPNNRKIIYTYDKIDRLQNIADASETTPIATYDYIGSRVIERVYKNGTKLTMLNDTGNENVGYDNLPRLTQLRHLGANNELIQGYKYTYNRVNFKTQKENLRFANLSEKYKLDSLYRVVDFKRGEIVNNDITTTTQTQSWQLDGVGNWANTTVDGEVQTQTVNNMNEYDSFAGVSFAHDDNGNLNDDGERLFTYDAMNRINEIRNKTDNEVIATYKYDFMNRRISKEFVRSEQTQGSSTEYATDANTIALYHYNEESGRVVADSSGNNNHGKTPRKAEHNVDGLFDTKAIKLKAFPVLVKPSQSLNDIEDELTVETFVYIDSQKWRFCKSGNLVHRFGSYELSIDRRTRKACFTVITNSERKKKSRRKYRDDDDDEDDNDYRKRRNRRKDDDHRKQRNRRDDDDDDDDDDHRWNRSGKKTTTVCSDREIPLNTWVHIAGVYDGNELKIVVNCQQQQDVKSVSGSIRKLKLTPLFLGGQGLFAKLEETRISNIARHEFNCDPDNGGTETTFTHILRKFLYSGWRVIEEREQRAEVDQPLGQEVVSRQFVDGLGIDEHLQIAVYDATGTTIAEERYLHENHRGDVVGVTDIDGNVVYRFEYSTYGEILEVNSGNELDEFTDFEEIVYGFQGRRLDSETNGLMYFRNRYYNPQLGRFISRDPLGYVDSMGLYEAFSGNPFNISDPMGLEEAIGANPGDHNRLKAKYIKKGLYHPYTPAYDREYIQGSLEDDQALLDRVNQTQDRNKRFQMVWQNLVSHTPVANRQFMRIKKFKKDTNNYGDDDPQDDLGVDLSVSIHISNIESAQQGIVLYKKNALKGSVSLEDLAYTKSGMIHESMLIWFAQKYSIIENGLNSPYSLHNALIAYELLNSDLSGVSRLSEESMHSVMDKRLKSAIHPGMRRLLTQYTKKRCIDVYNGEYTDDFDFTYKVNTGNFLGSYLYMKLQMGVKNKRMKVKNVTVSKNK